MNRPYVECGTKKQGFRNTGAKKQCTLKQTVYENEEVPVNFIAKMFQIVAWAQFERVAM